MHDACLQRHTRRRRRSVSLHLFNGVIFKLGLSNWTLFSLMCTFLQMVILISHILRIFTNIVKGLLLAGRKSHSIYCYCLWRLVRISEGVQSHAALTQIFQDFPFVVNKRMFLFRMVSYRQPVGGAPKTVAR